MAFSVVVKDVQKTFVTGRGRAKRTTPVLRGVSLSVRPKEMVAIVGPSGSGKSTLLYCMSGLEAVDGGSIEVMGQQVADASRNALSRIRRQHVGFIFQSYNLLPSLSARENVALPARLAGRPVSDARLNETLERVGLAGRERNRPQDLSGGEQQRVAIARVLASAPDVVFADEPTGALDTKNGREVLGMLRDIADEPSRSVVMVTHDLEAASMADRVLILRDGLILREMGRSSSKEILDAMEAAA
ncbi:ABC transporter related protein [Coriobacterium glomerans PW2]|uniref:ABC transporter related protein n=1 Tax=Coriobacterium glomerans (strain ATCC 49209 / DSM 20642 / JCM 10262 / PW2) TaxID=700015 RepID=F2N904_CORGP|nr:ABC transporter ATP-binding protein [Coriobacterium glomerans]AEB07604.1 ABC transporter related protein [Coriobacterium glomerans PW2]